MAKKSTQVVTETTKVEEAVEAKAVEETAALVVETVEKAPEKPKATKQIIAHASTPFRNALSLAAKHVVGQMQVGTAYGLVKEIKTINGNFYLLDNDYYITKTGNYTIY